MSKVTDIESNTQQSQKSILAYPWSNCEKEAVKGKFFMHHYVDYFSETSTGG